MSISADAAPCKILTEATTKMSSALSYPNFYDSSILLGGGATAAAASVVGRNQEQSVGAAAMCRQDQDRMALIAFADGVQVCTISDCLNIRLLVYCNELM